MHGLINKAIQTFVCQTYGPDRWVGITRAANLAQPEFEAMLPYDESITRQLLDALSADLARPADEILEDLGTFLVSNPRVEALRRLLRFGGVTYEEFLHSLDDLPDRTRLAVSDLRLPPLELREHARGHYTLRCCAGLPGYGSVMMGILRAMADDYGALVTLERGNGAAGAEVIAITLVETAFAEGRDFELGARL